MTTDRRWLDVPFNERNQAKAVGAQWDPLVRMWWVPMSVPVVRVYRWMRTPLPGLTAHLERKRRA